MGGEEEPAPSGRRAFWRSVSWSASRTSAPDGSRDCFSNEKNATNGQPKQRPAPLLTPRSNSQKARPSLPPLQPLAISRRSLDEWPKAGSDDLGLWPHPPTPGANADAHKLGDSLKVDVSSLKSHSKGESVASFGKECSKVADHIYLGGDFVAKNREILRQHGITHVLNCVGFVCPEYFKSDLVYRTLWLQDSPSEDITSILYDVFDYFEDVRQQKGRVFVHCCKGVSRSTSLVIAYLMWREGQSFDDAFQFVKAARGIADPNVGFACQLLQCQKRVHAIPVSPSSALRVYRMAPHSPYDPLHLVPKMLNDTSLAALDSRGAFIIHVLSSIYVWIGKNCDLVMENDAIAAAFQVVRYERVQGPISMIKEGGEPLDFWDKFLYTIASGNNVNIEKVQIESSDKFAVGKKRVEAYDGDFELFYKALTGGIVPPFSSPEHENETLLPARESSWSVFRRKFMPASRLFLESNLGKDMNTCSDRMQILNSSETSDFPPYASPSHLSSDSSMCLTSNSELHSVSPSTCSSSLISSPASHSTYDTLLLPTGSSQMIPSTIELSKSSLQTIYSSSKGLSQSIAERRGGFSPLKLSTRSKDASVASKKGAPNSAVLESDVKCFGECATSNSERCVKYSCRKQAHRVYGKLIEFCMVNSTCTFHFKLDIPHYQLPLVYGWPSVGKITICSIEFLDSKLVFLFSTPSASSS